MGYFEVGTQLGVQLELGFAQVDTQDGFLLLDGGFVVDWVRREQFFDLDVLVVLGLLAKLLVVHKL
jgi:hypothetical protein